MAEVYVFVFVLGVAGCFYEQVSLLADLRRFGGRGWA
jgi:hypothetical protein